jgi:hypothetical protein
MTKLLEKAFEKAAELPPADQDSFARWLLVELESERKWAEAFAGSQSQLARLAEQALAEHARGETEELDPERL